VNEELVFLTPADEPAAFPELDFSLPGSEPAAVNARRPAPRAGGKAPAIGSRAWAANAIVAIEVLGPPVALRSGATAGVPRAF
jgi:hypothetical protein